MDHFQRIYSSQADAYHRMIAVEDLQNNLVKALQASLPIAGARLVDLGSGTGRIPLLFKDMARFIVAIDLYRDMLRQNQLVRQESGGRWDLVQADMRQLPLQRGSADIVTAGWSIGHLRAWFSEDWQRQIGRILVEMHRLARPGGWLAVMETMTTGSLTPAPPTVELAEYYAWLEQEWGFTPQVIQTDYNFSSVEDAVQKTRFFFGDELAEKIRQNGWSRLPEWTGIWIKQVDLGV